MSKPRLLFLSQNVPYPPDGGSKIRTFYTIRELSHTFDITALCFIRQKGSSHAHDIHARVAGLLPYAHTEAFPIPQEQHAYRGWWDHLRSLATRRVYTRYVYDSRRFRARLQQLLRQRDFSVVHLDSLDLSGFLQDVAKFPVACTHHNVESVLLTRRAEREEHAGKRMYLHLQANLMRREEQHWCPRVGMNLAVSDDDAELLREIAGAGTPVTVAPNGVDSTFFQPSRGPIDGIISVGGTSWFPNKDGLYYLAQQILPELEARDENIRTKWVGDCTAREKQLFQDKWGIELTGYVHDIRPHVAAATCFIVPLRVGGGTRLKILAAWAMGKAVVSTAAGCEGLKAVDGQNIVIRDDPAAFADAIVRICTDTELRRHLEVNGRATVEQYYSWSIIGRHMTQVYIDLIGKRK